MKVPFRPVSVGARIVCPFCESGKLASLAPGFARCGFCGMPLVGSMLETLQDVLGLSDAVGAHPCECGHPEMRRLPDGVFHCPACRSEVLPIEKPPDSKSTSLGSASARETGVGPHPGAHTSLRVYGQGR